MATDFCRARAVLDKPASFARRAIVASDCGGLPELITDRKSGLLARNGDAQSYIRALDEMIEDADLRERCGAAARATVEERLTDVRIAEIAASTYAKAIER